MPNSNPLKEVYALIWRATKPEGEFEQSEFEARIPELMIWLKGLNRDGKLLACGGGGFDKHAGGLTLISAKNVEEAIELSRGSPMNEIGTTEVMIWDVFFADLSVPREFK